MAKIDFGGVIEDVITLDEFPLEKARKVLQNENHCDSGIRCSGPCTGVEFKGQRVFTHHRPG